ncbi:MAG TPA: hypothetical protein VGL77_12150, partial [Armatimonadota bacterium]
DPPAVTVMFLDGTKAVDLPFSHQFSDPCVTPALAPDGRLLAFSARVGNQSKLFTWRLDETNAVVGEPQRITSTLTDLSEKFPVWSPDGKHLAFLATDRASKTTLRVVNADGSGMVSLTPVTYFASPAWSPDSQMLLFVDQSADKPGVFNIPATGGKALPIRPESKVVAAVFSPDGKQIAALIQQDNGMTDLYIIPLFGAGGQAVVKNIVGGRSLCWRTPETIVFNAVRVGAQSGKAFWLVSATGEGLRGIPGYADPKEVAYFSVQQCDLTPYVPSVVDPTQRPGGGTLAQGDKPIEPEDLTEMLAAHAVTILGPGDDATVHGSLPIQIIARKTVASVALYISGQFTYATATPRHDDSVPRITYTWNTQALRDIDPDAGLPATYQEALRYPDGTYTLCAQALDESNKLIDQHIISVTLRNDLATDTPRGPASAWRYRFAEDQPADVYRIHGEATLLGAKPQEARDLNGTLDAAFRRTFVKTLPNDSAGFRTEVRGPRDRAALSYGQYQANLPEFTAFGAYAQTGLGEIVVAAQKGEQTYLPLAQLAVPFPETSLNLGNRWDMPMWVVADLFDREASLVNASHRLEGYEQMEGRRTLRIRSEYRLDTALVLHTAPSMTVPNVRGTRTALFTRLRTQPGMPGLGLPSLPGMQAPPAMGATKDDMAAEIRVKQAVGLRYAWFDPETCKLVRVEDFVLYGIPAENLSSAMAEKNTAHAQSTPTINTLPDDIIIEPKADALRWYLVHYLYTIRPDVLTPTKE